MSNQEFNGEDSSRFTLNVVFAFVVVFVFLMLMILWQGPYRPDAGIRNNPTEVYR